MLKNQKMIENKTPPAEQATTQHHLPIATLGIIVITAVLTSLQFFYPVLLPALDRNLEALHAGQWWRLITPRFVNPEIWAQYFLLVILALVGPAVERRYGRLRWLALWLAGGLTGEAVSFAWQPHGAGASVGICGIMGAWLVLLLRRENTASWVPSVMILALIADLVGMAAGNPLFGGLAGTIVAALLIQLRRRESLWHQLTPYLGATGLLGGLILISLRDQHGPPLLVGAGLAALFLLIESKREV